MTKKEYILKCITIKRIAWFSIILGLLVHLYFHVDLITNKVQDSSILNIFNAFMVIVTLSIITLSFYSFFFWIITKDAHVVEKWALKNLTKVCYFILIMLGISFVQRYLTVEQFLTSAGATIVFWYWYKKYERDKELDIVRYYSERYNLLQSINTITRPSYDDCRNLINLWFEEFFLFQRWYISQDLWNEWNDFIKQDINYILLQDIYDIEKSKVTEIDELVLLDRSNFLMNLVYFAKNNPELHQLKFYQLLFENIQYFYELRKKFHNKSKVEKSILDWFKDFLDANSTISE